MRPPQTEQLLSLPNLQSDLWHSQWCNHLPRAVPARCVGGTALLLSSSHRILPCHLHI